MDYFDRLRCSCCIQIMEYYTAISKKVRPRFSPLKWVHDILSSGKSQVHIRVPSLVPVLLKQIATTSLFVSVRQCLVTVRVHREELKKAHQAATVGFLRKEGGTHCGGTDTNLFFVCLLFIALFMKSYVIFIIKND